MTLSVAISIPFPGDPHFRRYCRPRPSSGAALARYATQPHRSPARLHRRELGQGVNDGSDEAAAVTVAGVIDDLQAPGAPPGR